SRQGRSPPSRRRSRTRFALSTGIQDVRPVGRQAFGCSRASYSFGFIALKRHATQAHSRRHASLLGSVPATEPGVENLMIVRRERLWLSCCPAFDARVSFVDQMLARKESVMSKKIVVPSYL